MLVPTMTPEEIYAEMYKDAEWLQDKLNNKVYPSVQKQIKRRTRFPYIHLTSVKSDQTKIEYNVAIFAYSRGDWNRPYSVIYTKYAHESGKTLIYIENYRFAIRIYTPHFLQRYKERHNEFVQEHNDIASLDLELFFILRNWDVAEMRVMKDFSIANPDCELTKKLEKIENQSKFWKDSDYERYSVACTMGVCLCEKHITNPKISIFDTFISPELLKINQWIDFAPAYSHVMLNAMCRVYPRHKERIVNEWNKRYQDLPEDRDPVPFVMELISELVVRYPIPVLY